MERLIYTFKERTRCDFQNIPYKKCPKLMVVSSLEANITWINVYPKKNGISKTLSTSAIVLGTKKIYAIHTTVQPGSYVHYKIKAISTNNTKTRITEAIKLRRSNERGGHYFMSLNTVHRLNSYQWKESPITDAVIDRVEEMDTSVEAP